MDMRSSRPTSAYDPKAAIRSTGDYTFGGSFWAVQSEGELGIANESRYRTRPCYAVLVSVGADSARPAFQHLRVVFEN